MQGMLRSGLVSISYRELSAREILRLCVQAKLEGIEWGGDIHVPHGNLEIAREVSQWTRDAGIEIACYGSYFRCDGKLDFEPVLASALELGAPMIRVWAGNGEAETRAQTLENLEKACEMAASQKIKVATEYHENTQSGTRESCDFLGREIQNPNLQTLWQPLRRGAGMNAKVEENLEDLRALESRLSNIHVYEWRDIEAGKTRRFSLQKSVQWPRYIEELQKMKGNRWLLLEYVPDDNPDFLGREADALRALLNNQK
ncbi:Sugar phosphate isomerase/epimerase [Abditibacterium utsteinense]|uniref:Sugar phosphate isomerase/epimerase n=1 Tax=Abditibacterium utsteinense TaxID=1960156 RepID=A0A2S8STZ4_9BACT|nr:TIM barrel protein [Abditibacterium utsteinense]PQV64283.1 Sugar phosphate isomerase/epimerase [Abditibacterium utsteinense]